MADDYHSWKDDTYITYNTYFIYNIRTKKYSWKLKASFIPVIYKSFVSIILAEHIFFFLKWLHYLFQTVADCVEVVGWLICLHELNGSRVTGVLLPFCSVCSLRHCINIPDTTLQRNQVKLERWVKVKHAAAALGSRKDTGPKQNSPKRHRGWEPVKQKMGGKKRAKTKQIFKVGRNSGSKGALKEMNPIPWCAFKGVICHAYCYCFNVVYWLAAHLHQG